MTYCYLLLLTVLWAYFIYNVSSWHPENRWYETFCRISELMENLPSCPCEDVRGSALSLKEQVMQDHVGRSEVIFHFSYIFFRWFHLCRHGGEMIIHYITPSSSLLSSTCVNLERLGGPLCAPGPPARSQILLVERNSHQLWITIWSLTFEIIRLSKSIFSMKSF